jgi:hypothetical protein
MIMEDRENMELSDKKISSAFAIMSTFGNGTEVEVALTDIPGVSQVFQLAGDHTHLAELKVSDNEALGRTIRLIRGIDGVGSLQTFVVVGTLKNDNSNGGINDSLQRRSEATDAERTPYQRFLDQLLAVGRDRCSLHDFMRVYHRPYTGATSSLTGAKFFYYIGTRWARVEIYIDRLDRDENKRIFDRLLEQKSVIEEAFGDHLNWERLDDRRASRISFRLPGGYNDPETIWSDVQEKLVDTMVKLQEALDPHLREIQ